MTKRQNEVMENPRGMRFGTLLPLGDPGGITSQTLSLGSLASGSGHDGFFGYPVSLFWPCFFLRTLVPSPNNLHVNAASFTFMFLDPKDMWLWFGCPLSPHISFPAKKKKVPNICFIYLYIIYMWYYVKHFLIHYKSHTEWKLKLRSITE